MNTHELLLHWIWAGAFFISGAYMFLRPDCITRIRGPFGRRLRVGENLQERFDAAVARREAAERLPRAIPFSIGAIAIGLGLLAALTEGQPAVMYGVLCLSISTITGIAYMQLRNMQSKRVAVLAPRSAVSVIPVIWYLLAAFGALAILSFAAHADLRVAAISVCISTLTTTAIAFRLAHLPALLSGEDVPVEQIVDDRVRTLRTCNVLALALVQPFVFCSQLVDRATSLELATMFATLAIFLAYLAWATRKRTAQPPMLTVG